MIPEILILQSPIVMKVAVKAVFAGITKAVISPSTITRSIKLNSPIDAELL